MHLNNLQPQSNQTSLFLKEPFFSKIQRFENYDGFFIPVLSSALKTSDFITLERNNSNYFCLHETERVNSLLVENLSDKPLLILNGELFDGAKQDRVANESVLIPNNSSIEIKVSCVEKGRWAYKTKAFSRGKNMFNYHSKVMKDLNNNSTKHKQSSGSIQDNVWKSIQNKQMRMGVSSRTGSVNDTYEKFEASVSSLRKKILEEDNQVGLLVMIPGKYIGLDLFSSNVIFSKYKERLYKSHLIELIENYRRSTRSPEKEINSFMLKLMYGKEVINQKDLGEEFSIYERDSQITSNALVLNNELIHLTAINNIDRRYAR
jgi:hypothetical protein